MAYIVNVTTTTPPVSNSYVATLGPHKQNDLIVIFVAWRMAGTIAISGYTQINTKQNNDAVDSTWFCKIAGSSSETNPTITTTGAVASGVATVFIIRDADVSGTAANAIDSSDYRAGATAATLTSAALTPTASNCLVLHGVAWDQTSVIAAPSDITLLGNMGNIGTVGATFNATGGAAIPTFTFTGSTATNAGEAWAIAVKNATGGALPQRLVDGRAFLQLLGGFSTLTTSAPNSVTGLTAIKSVAMGTATATVSTVQPPSLPWTISGTGFTSAENLAAPAFVGAFVAMPSTTDMDGENIIIPFGFAGTTDSGRVGAYGTIAVFVDASNNWSAYQLMPQPKMKPYGFSVLAVRLGVSATLDASATACDFTQIVKIGYFFHRVAGTTTAVTISIYPPIREGSGVAVIGGGTNRPIDTTAEALYLDAGGYYSGTQAFQGIGQLLMRVGLQYGNGSATTIIDHAAQSVETPGYDPLWLCGDYSAPVTLYASSSDVFDFSASILAAGYRQNFNVHASSSLSATYNFTGTSLVGWDVADNAGLTWVGTTFKDGGTATFAGGAELTNCVIKPLETIGASACAITANGSVLDGTTIDVTGTDATYHLELGTAVTDITLADVTFTGTPATDKVHVKATTGTVTITISGTTSLVAGDVTSDGATVVIDAPVITATGQIVGLVAGSRVQIYNVTASTEIYNDIVAGTSYSDTYITGTDFSADDVVRVRVAWMSGTAAKLPATYTTIATADGWAVLATQEDDAVYNLNAIDGDTVTEFVADYPHVQIDIDDPDGGTTPQRGYAWYISGQMTADGIAYYHGAMTAEDEGNYRINVDTLDLKLQNISASPVFITGARLYRSDGSRVTDTGTGNIEMEYGRVFTTTISTSDAVISGTAAEIIAAIPSAATIANEVVNVVVIP